jgi:hypothetical protein
MWEYTLFKHVISLTILFLVLRFSITFIMKVLRLYLIHTKTERPTPQNTPNVKEWNPITQGSLVKVKMPDDPTFKSRWDGQTGFVIGVGEDGIWYNVMFASKEGVMTYQVFKRSDLEYIRDVN